MAHDESAIQELLERGEVAQAVDATLDLYGNAIFGYLINITADRPLAEDLFQLFSIDLWRAIERFEWRSSLKTWAFTIARRRWLQHQRSPASRQPARLKTQDEQQLAAQVRTRTATWRRTAARDELAEAMESLDPHDRELLNLRIYQRLEWAEIASLLHQDDDPPLDHEALSRKSGTLRKQYQRLKDRLRDQLRSPRQEEP